MNRTIIGQTVAGLVLAGCVIGVALAQNTKSQPPPAESERQVKETEVPKAALEALKKLAGSAAITGYAEEIEHGSTFYEGSWKGSHGNVDAVVTPAGELVVIEEIVPAEMVAAAARAAAIKAAGNDAKITFEKKTVVLYEIHYKKDGRTHEMVFTPDGRVQEEPGAAKHEGDEDEEEKGEGDKD